MDLTLIIDQVVLAKLMQFFAICFALWLLVVAAILLDLWDGLYTARKTGVRIKSHVLRITIAKVSEYWRFMLIGALVDAAGTLFSSYALPYVSILFFLGLVGVEIKSMAEHAKRRKSHITGAADIISQIINCGSSGRAKEIMDTIAALQKSHLEKD